MFALRDLVSPRTWLAYTHHMAGLFIGLVASVLAVCLLALAVAGLPLMLLGIPVLGLTMRGAAWFAGLERARFGLFLGERLVPWPADARGGYRWGLVPRLPVYTERATWGEVGYALARLPASMAAAGLTGLAWSLSVTTDGGSVTLRQVTGGRANLAGTGYYSMVRPHITERSAAGATAFGYRCAIPFGTCGLNATLSAPAGMAVSVSTGGGNVTIVVPPGSAQYHVAASTDGGNVTDTVPQNTAPPNLITATSGGGDITIRQAT